VNALGIGVVNIGMALPAPQYAEVLLNPHIGDCMRSVTVRADRRIQVPLRLLGMADAFQGLGILVKMASPAAIRGGDGIVPSCFEISLRVFLGRETVMAVRTIEFAVCGGRQFGSINHQGYP